MKNDPALQHESSQSSWTVKRGQRENKGSARSLSAYSRKTELAGENEENNLNTTPRCPLHKVDHSLNVCRSFCAKALQERKDNFPENCFCYKCSTSKHLLGIAKQPSNVNVVGIHVLQQQCTQILTKSITV